MARATLYALFFLLLVALSQQLGNLYVNDIIGNSDTADVTVEDSVFDDNSLLTTFIDGLTDEGVYVEKNNYNEGDADIPHDLYVYGTTTIEGQFNPNGGIRSDAFPDGTFSFLVEDDTGHTSMKGELRVFGGIIADDGVFTVEDQTGETQIATALFKPNGGIDVQNGQFTVSGEDGTFFTTNGANVEGDVFLGTSISEDRYITRIAASSHHGGKTIVKGQNGFTVGGDIILEPGVGQEGRIGSIILGRAQNDHLFFGRSPVEVSGAVAGDTYFDGQNADAGLGGDIIFSAGDSTSAGNGGDVVLDVGVSDRGVAGRIILGNDIDGLSDFDLYISRPVLEFGVAGSTFIQGQATNGGVGGDLYVVAGDVPELQGLPGDLYLTPGLNEDGNEQGDIYLGRPTPVDLIITRYPIEQFDGGDTYIIGQQSGGFDGGDLILEAGDASHSGNGGDIIFETGSTETGLPGIVIWGLQTEDLLVTRTTSKGAGATTTIYGQTSNSGVGGDLIFNGGDANRSGGDILIQSGLGTISDGGSISFIGAEGSFAGGPVNFAAGTGFSGIGGDIDITAGSGATKGGNVLLNAGSGATIGDVVVTETANSFLVINVPVIVEHDLILEASGDILTISANPDKILEFNGVTILKDRIDFVQNVPAPIAPSIYTQVAYVQDTLQNLVNALGQCGHGLIGVVDSSNNEANCNYPGPVPTPIVRPIAH